MGHLRVGAAVKRSHRGVVRAPVIRTPSGLAKRLGRAVLWLLVLVLLLRGLASVMEPREPAAAVAAAPKPAVAAWPDDGVRAFAADFARAYLTYSPSDPEASADAVRAFVAPELASSVVPEYGEDAPRRAVGSVSVARVARVDDSHALVTVAAAATGGTRYLRCRWRGMRAAAWWCRICRRWRRRRRGRRCRRRRWSRCRRASAARSRTSCRASCAPTWRAIAGGLSYLVPAGVRIGALGQRHELVDVVVAGAGGAGEGPIARGGGDGAGAGRGAARRMGCVTGCGWCARTAGWWPRSTRPRRRVE